MTQNPKKTLFGDSLRFFRGQTVDRCTGKPLSQERLAYVLTEKTGRNINRNLVNNWENSKSYLHPQHDRALLTALISILYNYHGVEMLDQANQLLADGNYRALNPEEISAINPEWLEFPLQQQTAPSSDQGQTPSSQPVSPQHIVSGASPITVKIEASNPLPVILQTSKPNFASSTSLLNIGNLIANSLIRMLFFFLEKIPEQLASNLFNRLSRKGNQKNQKDIMLIDPTCGDQAIDLQQQRLKVSAAFGSYFTGLLEKDHSYFPISGQVELAVPPDVSELPPFQQIYWSLQYARGPEVILIAAEGGMGKSTLAAKIIRCLYSDNALDLLLGDSAKAQEVDPVSGKITPTTPEFYDLDSFLKKVCNQLSLDYTYGQSNQQQAISHIKDRIEGRRTVIVLDNLETVRNGTDLLNALRLLTGRDTRVLVTSRSVSGITYRTPGLFLIRLRPIQDEMIAKGFLRWHISRHISEHSDLQRVEPGLEEKENLRHIISKTGGIPLLMQLVMSDVARSSWSRIEKLPDLYGIELLNFLYKERWNELTSMGDMGRHAIELLFYIHKQTFHGKISYEKLLRWGKEMRGLSSLDEPLNILQERFLVVNNDLKLGNFSIFPSLADFLTIRETDKRCS